MTKDQAFDLVAQAIQQGGFLRYRKDFSNYKWTFCHPRHRPLKFQGATALQAVRYFVRMEKRWKERRCR